MDTSQIIAWWASLLCVLYSARLATTFLRRSPRLFTALALIACGWALLLPYYSLRVPSELYPAYGGFLLVYTGGLLALEANQRKGVHHDNSVALLQRVGLLLLLVIAVPSGFALRGPGNQTIVGLSILQSEVLVATLLDITGYVSAAYGLYRLCGSTIGVAFGVLAFLYSVLEIAFTIEVWPLPGATAMASMSPPYRYLLAAAKILFTAVFASSIAYQGMSDEVRRAGLRDWFLRFVNL